MPYAYLYKPPECPVSGISIIIIPLRQWVCLLLLVFFFFVSTLSSSSSSSSTSTYYQPPFMAMGEVRDYIVAVVVFHVVGGSKVYDTQLLKGNIPYLNDDGRC